MPRRDARRSARAVLGSMLALAAGCDSPPWAPASRSVEARALMHDGRERTYELFRPAAADGSTAAPLVLAFHGTGGSAAQMRRITGLDEVADEFGFFVVYPDGVHGAWNDGRPGINEDVDDVGFVAALLDSLLAAEPIDRTRIYATGLSNGGHLCYRLAFDLPQRVAGIAPVGALLSTALARRGATPGPMPVFLVAGDADPISPYGGGVVGGAVLRRGEVLSAAETVQFWCAANGAMTSPSSIVYTPHPARDDGTRVRVESFPGGSGVGADVVWVTIEGGGHTWPGGRGYLPAAIVGPTARGWSASRAMWEFFAGQGHE